MDKIIKPAGKISGILEVPGDKSISHRALILGSLCEGDVKIINLSTATDCTATMSCLKGMGIAVNSINGNTIVKGGGLHGFKEPSDFLDAQNSGTTMRLLSGLAAGQPFYTVITGDDSLRRRPMKRIIDPLRMMGAHILARDSNRYAPITIIGGDLDAIDYHMPIASAQLKSALLIAGLYCSGATSVTEILPSRDHTERMLKYLGARIKKENNTLRVTTGKLRSREIFVPGDISSAVYFIVAGLLVPDSEVTIKNVGLNKTRMGAIDALIKMGANIHIFQRDSRNEEPIGDITVAGSKLKSININWEEVPSLIDEIPLLAMVATQAEGTTVISGAEELRHKESDRLAAISSQLQKMGASVDEQPDGLVIHGPTPLKGANVDSLGDHRIAMTMAVAGLIADSETKIDNADSVAISFPEFFGLLSQLQGGST